MTDLGINESEPEDEETNTKIKQKHLKSIKNKSKDFRDVKESDFSEITEEQRREIKRLEAKVGKVVVKKDKGEEDEDEDDKKTKAEKVLDAATANIKKLFVDEYQEPHAAIFVNNEHLETIPIRSRRFRNYLSSVVYNDCEMVVDSQTLKDVIGLLSARAEFGEHSEIIKLNLRVAESETAKNGITT